MFAVNVAVGDFFARGGAHGGDFAAKAQRLAGQRVIAVQMHLLPFDFDDVKHLRLTIVADALDAPAHLHARWKFGLGNGANQRRVVLAKGVFGAQIQRGGETGSLAVQRRFDLGEDVVVAAMQIGQIALVHRLALGRGDLVRQGDGGVFGDVHGFLR